MGRFIRELDVCVRWQVAWQGRKRKETGGILCSYLHMGVFLQANTSILEGLIVYLQLGVNQLEPHRYFLMKMLSPLRSSSTNYFIGSNNSQRYSQHFSSLLIVLPLNTDMCLAMYRLGST